MTDINVTIPLQQFLDLVSQAERVPALESSLNQLKKSYDGLSMLYSEILEALRSK